MLNFYIDSLYTKFLADDDSEHRELYNLCSAYVPGYQYSRQFKMKVWDGRQSLIYKKAYIPTGIVGYVVRNLREKGFECKVYWKKGVRPDNNITVSETTLNGIILRDYQVACANKLLSSGRGVAEMATNSGKTAVFAAIIKASGLKSLIVVRSIDLLHQLRETVSNYIGSDVGIIGDGEQDYVGKNVIVATIQTLHKQQKKFKLLFKSIELLVVDECHHLSSDTYMQVLFSIPAKFRYGFSGTPLSYTVLLDLKLMSQTGDILYTVTNAYLIEHGYSSQPIIHMHSASKRTKDSWMVPYQTAYKLFIVENEKRNKLIRSICKSSSGVTLVIVQRLDHCSTLAELIEHSTFITGSDDSIERKNLLQRMKTESGDLVVIATNIFDEGLDVSNISNIVLAAGGKSRKNVLQRIGRGLRRNDRGDNVVHIHDFHDDANKHLKRHSEERLSVYIEQGFKVQDERTPISSISNILKSRNKKSNRERRSNPKEVS